jgi:hypothetical protein
MKKCCADNVRFRNGDDTAFCPVCGTEHRSYRFGLSDTEIKDKAKAEFMKKYQYGRIYAKIRNKTGLGEEILKFHEFSLESTNMSDPAGITVVFQIRTIAVSVYTDKYGRYPSKISNVTFAHRFKDTSVPYTQSVVIPDKDLFGKTSDEVELIVRRAVIPVCNSEISGQEFKELEAIANSVSASLIDLVEKVKYNHKDKKCL